ncbi:uncharacterized protein LOC114357070 [Ostrinia furnacalis]|uniref:uncharacterized protein LOC114357070 n=1 Tax=Ostrinia furnacalis TaxID=93504 RepID=UPI001040DD15|nr:uncharacterized protein LOC114357070 [Ostrinia furnacalis]
MIRNGHFQFIHCPTTECTSDVAKMFRAVLIFLLLARVNTELKSVQQSVYVSRKSRSNSAPIETGYVYSQVNNKPGTLAMFGSDASNYNSFGIGQYNDYPGETSKYDKKSAPYKYASMEDVRPAIMPYTEPPMSSYDINYSKSKAEMKFDSHYLPSKMKSDAMYEKLKSLMHYKYPDNGPMVDGAYDTMNDYRIDEDDIRTSSRSTYDSWPYFYHSPYEYEAMKMGSDVEKAKDKRYISQSNQDSIPVHEDVDDIPHYYNRPVETTIRYDRDTSADNPVFGDQAFFSFVLNDYFDKSSEEDPLIFKGLDWGKEFDHEASLPDMDDYLKRDRRLGSKKNYDSKTKNYDNNARDQTSQKSIQNYDSSKLAAGESSTEKGYNKKHAFDKHEKGDERKSDNRSAYENAGNNYRGFKDFVDTFANKFGGEEHMKDSKYVLKQNADKGENRKGFRRVYHKDEYQEDNEFFDNTNNSAKAEEKGGSTVHRGGSEAFLKSHATAATGNEANAYNNAGNALNNSFERNHKGHDQNKGFDNEFNRYRDVAKKAALSNSADYIDRYRS